MITQKKTGLLRQLPHFFLASAMCLPLATLAQATDNAKEHRYWSIHAGMNNLSDWPAVVDFGGPTVDAALTLKRGMTFGAAAGKQYGQARYELEYQHGRFDIRSVTIGPRESSVSADGQFDVLMANAYRSTSLTQSLSLYGALGLGIGRVSLPQIQVASGCNCLNSASKAAAAYQLRAGLEFQMRDDGFGFAQIGWLSLPGAKSQGTAFVSYPRHATALFSVGYRSNFK